MVCVEQIAACARQLELSGKPLCVHASMRSFSGVDGGPAGLIDAMLREGCMLMVPTLSYTFMLRSQPGMQPPRNGWEYGTVWDRQASGAEDWVYHPDCADVAPEMGALPAAVLATPGRVRGNHPLCSFTALGRLAGELLHGQSPLDLCAPLSRLADLGGWVILMGLGLDRLTLLHLPRRWPAATCSAAGPTGPMAGR
jgi:aminoglycoside N3'-acetyltransferase